MCASKEKKFVGVVFLFLEEKKSIKIFYTPSLACFHDKTGAELNEKKKEIILKKEKKKKLGWKFTEIFWNLVSVRLLGVQFLFILAP